MGRFASGAIIAAGSGERLRGASGGLPKPLVTVERSTLLEHQVAALLDVGVLHVHVIVNSETARLMQKRTVVLPAQVELMVADTANSMESLLTLGPRIAPGAFLLTTVDTILPRPEWHRFATAAAAALETDSQPCDGALGITRWRGDARALFVRYGSHHNFLTRLSDDPAEFVTAGVYAFTTTIFDHSALARGRRLQALRRFLGLLIDEGLHLTAIELEGAIDVDEPADLELARAVVGKSVRNGEAR